MFLLINSKKVSLCLWKLQSELIKIGNDFEPIIQIHKNMNLVFVNSSYYLVFK